MASNAKHSGRIHLGLFLAEAICVSAFVLEISRALSGNTLSWAYVVEWPILGAYAVYMWRKLLRDEEDGPARHDVTPVDDPHLDAWNAYLTQVHAHERREGHSTPPGDD